MLNLKEQLMKQRHETQRLQDKLETSKEEASILRRRLQLQARA